MEKPDLNTNVSFREIRDNNERILDTDDHEYEEQEAVSLLNFNPYCQRKNFLTRLPITIYG